MCKKCHTLYKKLSILLLNDNEMMVCQNRLISCCFYVTHLLGVSPIMHTQTNIESKKKKKIIWKIASHPNWLRRHVSVGKVGQ